jgi:hypothetical protein
VYQTTRVFRLEAGVENVKIFHLAQGEGVDREFDRAPGPGAGFEVIGKRTAPPLKAWPYTTLPVGEIVTHGSDISPNAVATGWEGMPQIGR